MSSEVVKRKLTAILSADVKGYSRLMGEDEVGTIRTINIYKEIMANFIQQHHGRVVDAPGDNLLAEFASVVDAVQCAVEIQKELKTRNAVLPENRRMEFRIGVNLGDVVEDGEQILGDGVNIAARLESLSEAGGICISGKAYDEVKHKLNLGYKYLGEQTVKNILEPVRVYRVLMEPEAAGKVIGEKKAKPRQWRKLVLPMGVVLIVIVAAVVVWRFYLSPTPPPREVASKEKMAFPLPDRPSIAVLPFVNMSKDPEQEYFSDGMTEDLITDLSKISGLVVIARNSTFTYKGKAVKIKQVAEELGVRYVLEGSVRRAGDEVRINAQLIDAMTGHHLWAERYDGRMDRIFALQDQITQKIVSALAVKLTGGEKELVVQRGTGNVVAYDEFLRGWGYYLRLTPEDLARAASSFRKALELDPNYWRAYAALALVYWTGSDFTLSGGLGISFVEARLRSREYLQKAIKQPTSIAYTVSSQMYLDRRQHKEAISELERALSLDTNDPACLASMGNTLNMAGRPMEAIEYVNRGMRLDPHNPSRYLAVLAMAHFCMGELKEAATLGEKALRLNPENLGIATNLAVFYGLLGRDQEARAMLDTLRTKVGYSTESQAVARVWAIQFMPFKDRTVADRYAEGLLKAGYLPETISAGYFPAFKENQLTGEKIKALLFGSTITGSSSRIGQWWIDFKRSGEFTWRGATRSDSGKSRIEGDMICTQYQKNWWGLDQCATVFRNPSGTPESKDEYFFVGDTGISTFSPGR